MLMIKISRKELGRRLRLGLNRVELLPEELREQRRLEVIKRFKERYKTKQMICPTCKEEKAITNQGKYATVLECNHVVTSIPIADIMKNNVTTGVEAARISDQLSKTTELPKIDSQELINRALSTMTQTYEEFFTTENPTMDDIIAEHGKDNAVLIFTAIHSHMSRVLFTLNRFRNFYYTRIEQMRKEVEDKAVKELISNHDFHYTPTDKKPKKVRTVLQSGTSIDAAKEAMGKLTDKDGNPIDVMKVLSSLMWKKTPADLAKESEKNDYKAGLDKIKESITSKE